MGGSWDTGDTSLAPLGDLTCCTTVTTERGTLQLVSRRNLGSSLTKSLLRYLTRSPPLAGWTERIANQFFTCSLSKSPLPAFLELHKSVPAPMRPWTFFVERRQREVTSTAAGPSIVSQDPWCYPLHSPQVTLSIPITSVRALRFPCPRDDQFLPAFMRSHAISF